jgi:hypothetical protein
MDIRQPARAGSFYDGSPERCRRHALQLLEQSPTDADLPRPVFGGIVPHAGWVFSGALAARTLKALEGDGPPRTLVLLGADHFGLAEAGEVYHRGAWRTPVGDVAIDEELAEAILQAGTRLRANPQAHAHEHSLEVQVPFIKLLYPAARIVPITVPPTFQAVEIGQTVGSAIAGGFAEVAIVGSTDLSHHGGHFPAPGGHGAIGAKWTAANDRRILNLMETMDAQAVIPEADAHGNACGAGAIAATIAACRALGATRGVCLQYTNSYQVVHAMAPNDSDDTTVGYASVVFA